MKFTLNGESISVDGDKNRKLLWVLRVDAAQTGTKYGCGQAMCGACTVLVDGEPTLSCITPMRLVEGKSVKTIEGLPTKLSKGGEKLHPLQEAFIEMDALQCGYCTPGMIMNAASLLDKNPSPTRKEVVTAMEGNICRCGSYGRIVEAIQLAGKNMRRQK